MAEQSDTPGSRSKVPHPGGVAASADFTANHVDSVLANKPPRRQLAPDDAVASKANQAGSYAFFPEPSGAAISRFPRGAHSAKHQELASS